MMTEAGISCYTRNCSKVHRRCPACLVFCIISVCLLSVDVSVCLASPTAAGGVRGREDERVKRAVILEHSPRSPEVTDPHEKCFETTCNRVTHYCDEAIRSCASCEDDCHPGRIKGDDQATQECLQKCDWYYYINSLKSSLCSTSEPTELSAGFSEHAKAELTDFQLFAIVLAVVTACFTIVIVTIIGVFCCLFKKFSQKRAVVRQETAEQSSSLYKPLRPSSSTGARRKQSGGDTNIKLLVDNYESVLNNRTVQHENIRNSSYAPSSISLASTSEVHNCINKAYVAHYNQSSTASST